MTDQQIRLHFGELNASEMRLARAIVGWHERQMKELKRWKAEAQAVEAEWNPQELAKMLGATLGQSCRQVIQKRVPEILAENAKLRAGMVEAFKIIDVLYRDALANNEEGWPMARQWMEQWEEFKPSNQATKK